MTLKMIVNTAHEAFLLNDQILKQVPRGQYTWRYTPAVNTWLGDEVITPAIVEFKFDDKQWETYFQLRWTQ